MTINNNREMIPLTKLEAINLDETANPTDRQIQIAYDLMLVMMHQMFSDYFRLQTELAHKLQDNERLIRKDEEASTHSWKSLAVNVGGGLVSVGAGLYQFKVVDPEKLKNMQNMTMVINSFFQTGSQVVGGADRAALVQQQSKRGEVKHLIDTTYQGTQSCREQQRHVAQMAKAHNDAQHEAMRSVTSH